MDLSENARVAVAKLLRLSSAQRPAALEKLVTWLARSGCCAVRLEQLVKPTTLVSAMLPLLEAEPALHRRVKGFATPDEAAAPCDGLVQAAAARAASRLLHMRDAKRSFLAAPVPAQCEWLCSQAFGYLRVEPSDLVAELLQHGLVAFREPQEVACGASRLVYGEERLRSCPRATSSTPWSRDALFFDGDGCEFSLRGFDPRTAAFGKEGLPQLQAWLEARGLSLTLCPGSIARVTSKAGSDCSGNDPRELRLVLLLVGGVAPPIQVQEHVYGHNRGFFIGAQGAHIRRLERELGIRIKLAGNDQGSFTLTAWASLAVLRKVGPKDSLQGLAHRVASHLRKAGEALERYVPNEMRRADEDRARHQRRRSAGRAARRAARGTKGRNTSAQHAIEAVRLDRQLAREAAARKDQARRGNRAAKRERRRRAARSPRRHAGRHEVKKEGRASLRGGRHKGGETAVEPYVGHEEEQAGC